MIIGISAKMGCGKSTLAKLFLEKHPEYTRIAFADCLKEECSQVYEYPLEWNYTEDGKSQIVPAHFNLPKNNMTVREVLQWHGTDFRREQDPNYWVEQMDKILVDREAEGKLNIVIDDVRFKNEVDLIDFEGGINIRLNPYPEWKPGENANHQSEIDLDDYSNWDLVLNPEYGKLADCIPLIEEELYKCQK